MLLTSTPQKKEEQRSWISAPFIQPTNINKISDKDSARQTKLQEWKQETDVISLWLSQTGSRFSHVHSIFWHLANGSEKSRIPKWLELAKQRTEGAERKRREKRGSEPFGILSSPINTEMQRNSPHLGKGPDTRETITRVHRGLLVICCFRPTWKVFVKQEALNKELLTRLSRKQTKMSVKDCSSPPKSIQQTLKTSPNHLFLFKNIAKT